MARARSRARAAGRQRVPRVTGAARGTPRRVKIEGIDVSEAPGDTMEIEGQFDTRLFPPE